MPKISEESNEMGKKKWGRGLGGKRGTQCCFLEKIKNIDKSLSILTSKTKREDTSPQYHVTSLEILQTLQV